MAVDMNALLRSNEEGKKKADQFLRERYGVATREPAVNLSALIPRPQSAVKPAAAGVNAVNTALLPQRVMEAANAASQLASQPKPVNWQTRPYWQPWEENEYNGLAAEQAKLDSAAEQNARLSAQMESLRRDNTLTPEQYKAKLAELEKENRMDSAGISQIRQNIARLETARELKKKQDDLSRLEGVSGRADFEEVSKKGRNSASNPIQAYKTIDFNERADYSLPDYLTDKERAVIDYYTGIGDFSKANEYLLAVSGELSRRAGEDQAKKTLAIENDFLRDFETARLSVNSGLSSGFTGISEMVNRLAGNKTPLDQTAISYAYETVRPELTGAQALISDIGYSVGNMTPSIAVGMINPLAGSVTMGVSSAGNSYAEARRNGYSDDQALAYGILNGVSESAMQYLLGGIGKLGKGGVSTAVSKIPGFSSALTKINNVTSKLALNPKVVNALKTAGKIAADANDEGIEEYLQATIDPIFRNVILGENNEIKAFSEEQLYSYLLGALTSVGMNAATGEYRNIVLPDGKTVQVQVDENGNPVETSQNVAQSTSSESNVISPIASENAPVNGTEAGRITLKEFTDNTNPVWNFVDYSDSQTKTDITQKIAGEMIQAGNVVELTDSDLSKFDQYYPDLRGMKKQERTPILRGKIKEVKNYLSNMLKEKFGGKTVEFTVNGNVLEAKLYDAGIREVLEKVTQEKAAMIDKTGEIFSKAQYLYSTTDKAGNPNIYRWNYFYVPLKVGNDTYGVRIAVRDMKVGNESQIYNYGIKKDAALPEGPVSGQGPNFLSDGHRTASTPIIPNSSQKSNTAEKIVFPTYSDAMKRVVMPGITRGIKTGLSEERTVKQASIPQSEKSVMERENVKNMLSDIADGAEAVIDVSIPEDIAQSLTGKGISSSKDISRNLDAASNGSKRVRQVLYNIIERPFFNAKNSYSKNVVNQMNSLKEISNKYGIKAGSEESAAVQRFGEGQYMDSAGEMQSYTLDDLKRDFPDTWENIVAVEKYCRKVYDNYINRVNESLELIYPDPEGSLRQQILHHEANILHYQNKIAELLSNSSPTTDNSKQISAAQTLLQREQTILQNKLKDLSEGNYLRGKRLMPRKDYYHHYNEMESGFGGLENILKTSNDIDPHLAGISEFTKPKSKFAGWLQKRRGGEYTEDAIGGLVKYIPTAEYKIALDPVIARNRGLIKSLVDATENTRNANSLISQLTDWTNDLAGKTNRWDRTFLGNEQRKRFAVVKWINGRYKSNAVMGNLSSAISQFFNLPNATAYVKNPASWAKGIKDYATHIAEGFGAKSNATELIDQSGFIRERYMDKAINQFDEGVLKTPRKLATWLLNFGDEQATKMIWYSAYEDAVHNNLSDPINYADDITRRSVAGRGVGETPLTQKSQLIQLIAPFQVEVNNTWQLIKERVKNKDGLGLLLLFIASWLMNGVSEELTGRRVAFDPIDAIEDAIKEGTNPDNNDSTMTKIGKGLGRVGGELLSAVPGGSVLAMAALDDQQREALFGESDPTRYGVGIAGITAMTKPITQFLTGQNVDLVSPALNLALPFGGKQVERTLNAAQDFGLSDIKFNTNSGFSVSQNQFPASLSDSGRLRFAIDPNPVNIAKDFAFGPFSTSEGKEYINNNLTPLSEKATALANEAYKQGINPNDYTDLVRKLNKVKKNEDKRNIIANSSLTTAQKNWIDDKLINDVMIIPKDVKMDYTNAESMRTSLMSDSKKEKYEAAKNAGYSYDVFEEYYKILHLQGLKKEDKIQRLTSMGISKTQAEKIWDIMY